MVETTYCFTVSYTNRIHAGHIGQTYSVLMVTDPNKKKKNTSYNLLYEDNEVFVRAHLQVKPDLTEVQRAQLRYVRCNINKYRTNWTSGNK